jgi:hypothetical protein
MLAKLRLSLLSAATTRKALSRALMMRYPDMVYDVLWHRSADRRRLQSRGRGFIGGFEE